MEEEDKPEFQGKGVLDAIRFGTSFNAAVDNVMCWKDHLKVLVHPQFNSPHKPPAFGDVAFEYSNRTRNVVRKLLEGISLSLGLEPMFNDKAIDLDKGLHVTAANYYPPCPQPELDYTFRPRAPDSDSAEQCWKSSAASEMKMGERGRHPQQISSQHR